MTSTLEIELPALVEKLDTGDFPKAAALLFKAWCDDRGASDASVHEFFLAIIEMQSGEPRQQLEYMADTYRFGRSAQLGGSNLRHG